MSEEHQVYFRSDTPGEYFIVLERSKRRVTLRALNGGTSFIITLRDFIRDYNEEAGMKVMLG